MTMTAEEVEQFRSLLRHRPPPDNAGLVDVLVKLATAVCTAGILWLVSNVATLQKDMALVQQEVTGISNDQNRVESFMEKPRFTVEDFRKEMAPIVQRIELIERDRVDLLERTRRIEDDIISIRAQMPKD